MKRKILFVLMLLTAIALIGMTKVSAVPVFKDTFNAKYGTANTRIDSCNICHIPGTIPARNSFGLALNQQGINAGSTGAQLNLALTNIEGNDSDGDKFTNIAEIRSLTFPGNAGDFPPNVTGFSPASPVMNNAGESRTFSITVNQPVEVKWFINGTEVFNQTGVNTSVYTNNSAAQGTWNVTAVSKKAGDGTTMQKWDWIVTATPALTTVNVTPSTATVISGNTQNFTATGLDQNNNTIAFTPLWHTTNNTVGTINSSTGVFTAIKVGTATVHAFNGSLSGTPFGQAIVTVISGPLATILISPSAPTVQAKATLTFMAAGADAAGNTVAITPTWSSSNLAVGTINATTGMFTALAAGTTTVNSTAQNITGISTVTVQVVNGTINGSVRNASSGLGIAGATVTANGMSAATNALGKYEISIAPGTYNVTANANGFVQNTTLNVVMTSGNRTDVDFALQPIVAALDTKPPEAIISFNTTTKDFQVVGIDDMDPNVKVKSKIINENGNRRTTLFTLTDLTGNMLDITLKIKREDDELKAEILDLVYTNTTNTVEIVPPENKFKNEFATNKAGSLRALTQKIKVKNQFEIRSKFRLEKGNTEIKIEEESKPEIEVTLPGLVTINLRTEKGALIFDTSEPISVINHGKDQDEDEDGDEHVKSNDLKDSKGQGKNNILKDSKGKKHKDNNSGSKGKNKEKK